MIVPWRDPYIYCICLSGVFQQLKSEGRNSLKKSWLVSEGGLSNLALGERFGFG